MKISFLDPPSITLQEQAEPSPSPVFDMSMQRNECEATYLITDSNNAMEDAITLANDLLPQMIGLNDDTAADYLLSYKSAHRYQNNINGANRDMNLRCDRVSVEPWGKTNDEGDFLWTSARLKAHYTGQVSTRAFSPVLTESIDPVVEFVTRPNRKLFWDGAAAVPLNRDESPGTLVQLLRWSYTIKGLPGLPGDIIPMQGLINDAVMTSDVYKMSFAIGTVLFKTPMIVPTVGMNGADAFDVTWEFLARPVGLLENTWNLAWRAGFVDPQEVFDDNGVQFNQYKTTNLSDLLLVLVN